VLHDEFSSIWHEFNMLANALSIHEEWSRVPTLIAFEEELLLLFSEFGRLLADRALKLNRLFFSHLST